MRSRPGLARKWILLLGILGSAAVNLTAGELIEAPGNPRSGRDLFISKGCIRCHSIWSAGAKRGPALASVGMGRNLYELCASLWSHWSRMNAVIERDNEPRPLLTAPESRDIIAYLYYLNYNCEPGEAESGEKIFRSRDCIQCHVTNPLQAAGKPGRPVYEMSQFTGPVALAVAVWNHGDNMTAHMARAKIAWPQFQGKEVADLVAFLRASNWTKETEMVVPGDPARGKLLFTSKGCERCHKPGSGLSQMGPDLASSGAAVSVSALVAGLWNHHPKMSQTFVDSGIPYPRISLPEMEDLLSYIYWLKAYGLTGNAQTGRNLYQTKQCALCHSTVAGKPGTGTCLIQSEAAISPYALLAAIWNHGPRMEALLQEKKLPWPELSGEEMRDLVAYFQRSNSGRKPNRNYSDHEQILCK